MNKNSESLQNFNLVDERIKKCISENTSSRFLVEAITRKVVEDKQILLKRLNEEAVGWLET